jgi:predicted dehydrogenase
MAFEHAKAALELEYDNVFIIGRSQKSFEKYFDDLDSNARLIFLTGGLETWFQSAHFDSTILHINAVAIEALNEITHELVKHKIQKILLEKPGALEIEELQELKDASEYYGSKIVIGYNRRHYASIRKLKKILSKENITSFEFEFTEWVDRINPNDYSEKALNNWIKSNSAHVIDTAFYLASGMPTELNAISKGKNQITWHPQASVFIGSGMVGDIPFSYNADWTSQGRWKIYIRTDKGKYVLEPMEKLGFIPKNSIHIQEVTIDDDKSKPGLEHQIRSLENSSYSEFCSIDDQIELFRLIKLISA